MESAIASVHNVMVWSFGCLALLPFGLAAARLWWSGEDQASRSQALIASLVLSPFLFGAVVWLGSWLIGLPISSSAVKWTAVIAVLVSIPGLRGAFPDWPITARIIGAYFVVFLLWVGFRIFSPEIFWGEKPMDFSFLNYLVRAESLPPDDPWAAGHPLNYYYFGQFVWAVLHKLTGVDTAYGFNLALSSVGAGIFAGLWALLNSLGVSRSWAVLGAALIALCSNFEWLKILVTGERPLGFDLFWATSRLLTSPAITEYLSWSVMFGDLHAHMIGLPVSALCYAVMVRLMQRPSVPFAGWALFGFVEALLYATNSWELIPHGGFFALVLFSKLLPGLEAHPFRHRLIRVVLGVIGVGLGALLFVNPWLVALGEPVEIGYGWVVGGFATPWQLTRHFGQFLIPILIAIPFGLLCVRALRWRGWLFASLAAAVPLGLVAYLATFSPAQPPFALIAGCALLVLLGMAALLTESRQELGVLLVASGMLVALAEMIYVMDHTNTVFKLYLSIWMWLGAASIVALSHLWSAKRGVRRSGALAVAGIAVLIATIGFGINSYSLAIFQRVQGPRPTLNGMLYLPSISQSEAELIFWMRRNISGVPVIVEAVGDGYREFGRITMNTGLPAVLGWEYHVSQRGVDEQDRAERLRAVSEIFAGVEVDAALSWIGRYGVRYIVVGEVERGLVADGRYSEASLRKFRDHPEYFRRVFYRPGVELYEVVAQGVSRPLGSRP